MNIEAKQLKKLHILAVLALLPLFAGCGGDGDEGGSSAQSNSGLGFTGALMCVAVVLVSGDDQCVENAVSGSGGSSGGSGGSGGTPPGPGTGGGSGGSNSGTIRILGQYEMEPNDSLINADPVGFSSSTDVKVGFTVEGHAHEADDSVDYYTFVRPRSRTLRFQLCPPETLICENGVQIDTLTAFVDILDQDGRVLSSTQAASQNVLLLEISAGISYYVRVTAGDTMGSTVGYQLTGYETN